MYGINVGCLTDVSDEELSRLPITYIAEVHHQAARIKTRKRRTIRKPLMLAMPPW